MIVTSSTPEHSTRYILSAMGMSACLVRSSALRRLIVLAPFLLSLWGCSSAPIAGGEVYGAGAAGFRSPALVGPVRRVVIDAGHGGRDPGASHFGLKEKHVTLDIARRLRANLKEAGLSVAMTRDSDRFVALSSRADIANRIPADIFVSVHINANRSRHISGAEVYYPRESVISARVPWPPMVTPAHIGIPSSATKQILWDLVLRRARARSVHLARAVCQSIKRDMQVSCRTKRARFVVLREAWMPSILIEVGYMSNRREAKKLHSASYRSRAARAICRGILAYAGRLEGSQI